jgi:hypothetical protein
VADTLLARGAQWFLRELMAAWQALVPDAFQPDVAWLSVRPPRPCCCRCGRVLIRRHTCRRPGPGPCGYGRDGSGVGGGVPVRQLGARPGAPVRAAVCQASQMDAGRHSALPRVRLAGTGALAPHARRALTPGPLQRPGPGCQAAGCALATARTLQRPPHPARPAPVQQSLLAITKRRGWWKGHGGAGDQALLYGPVAGQYWQVRVWGERGVSGGDAVRRS